MGAKTHLNTLFVGTDGSYVAKEGEALVVRRDDAPPFRIPVHLLSSVACFGRVGMSPPAMALCAERGVAVTFLTSSGRYLARVTGHTSGNVLLRKAQFRTSESTSDALELARPIVAAKLYNSRVLIQRSIRDHGDDDGTLGATAARLRGCIRRSEAAIGIDQLRGIEGEAAKHYFGGFRALVRVGDGEFRADKRSRRPPRDPLNALLSFGYALLAADCRAACEEVGLDPQVGYLHADRPGRASLALDLMEELRTVIADRVVLSLINRRQARGKNFEREVGGAVRMDEGLRRLFITEYQKRKAEEIEHPFLREKMTLGVLPLVQARLLAKAIRGELDGYPPYLWR